MNKYAANGLKVPTSTLPTTPAAHDELHQDGAQPTSLLSHIAKQVGGRKQLCYLLRISKSLLDQQIAGVKDDPMIRCKKMMRALVASGRPDFALAVAEDVASEINAVVFTADQLRALRALARSITP